jgi:transposase-like protein
MPKGQPQKKYSGEFKQKVVETMQAQGLSYKGAARMFDLKDPQSIKAWEQIYMAEGLEGLNKNRRKEVPGPRNFRPKAEESLIEEVQRLRAENAYLKKLNALVQEREQREKKPR